MEPGRAGATHTPPVIIPGCRLRGRLARRLPPAYRACAGGVGTPLQDRLYWPDYFRYLWAVCRHGAVVEQTAALHNTVGNIATFVAQVFMLSGMLPLINVHTECGGLQKADAFFQLKCETRNACNL